MIRRISEKQWCFNQIPKQLVNEFTTKLRISPFLAKMLINRGIDDVTTASQFINPDNGTLHNPFLFNQMHLAVDRTLRAMAQQESVLIYGDSDVDGVTSSALLHRYLSKFLPHCKTYIPSTEGYGLNCEVIDSFLSQPGGVDLIITVDCGISNVAEAEYIASHGVDLIIIDHHECQSTLPQSVAVIDAKLPDCQYPFRDLAGVGTTLKFVTACFLAAQLELMPRATAIDVETTGLEPHQDEIIEVAAVRFRYGIPCESFSQLIKIDGKLDEEICSLTGITDTLLQTDGKSPQEVFAEWHQFIGEDPLIGHNIKFDLSFLKPALKKYLGINFKPKCFDSWPESKAAFPGLKSYALEQLSHKFNLADGGSHRAEADALCAGKLFFMSFYRQRETKIEKFRNYFLDLVSLGTIADVVPLHGENRTLAKRGLSRMASSPSKGLKLMVNRQLKEKDKLSSRDISWGIAPQINAAGRIGQGALALELLTTTQKKRAKALIEELKELTQKQRAKVQHMFEEFNELLQQNENFLDEKVICLYKPGYEAGITGVVANRFLGYYNKPVFIITSNGDKATGSARAFDNLDLQEILEANSKYFTQYGGHKQAAGFSLEPEKIGDFMTNLRRLVNEEITDPLIPRLLIDLELYPSDLSLSLIDDLAFLEPFGQGNPFPHFALKGILPIEINTFGVDQRHLRIIFDGNHSPITSIGWNMGELSEHLIQAEKPLDIAFILEKNVWRRRTSLRLILEHVRISDD